MKKKIGTQARVRPRVPVVIRQSTDDAACERALADARRFALRCLMARSGGRPKPH